MMTQRWDTIPQQTCTQNAWLWQTSLAESANKPFRQPRVSFVRIKSLEYENPLFCKHKLLSDVWRLFYQIYYKNSSCQAVSRINFFKIIAAVLHGWISVLPHKYTSGRMVKSTRTHFLHRGAENETPAMSLKLRCVWMEINEYLWQCSVCINSRHGGWYNYQDLQVPTHMNRKKEPGTYSICALNCSWCYFCYCKLPQIISLSNLELEMHKF